HFLAGADIVVELGPGRKQRAVIVELRYRKRRHRAGRIAKADKQAARFEAGQRTREGRLADAVIDDVAELVAADLFHAGDEILLIVEDDVRAAIGEREIGLLLRADRADHMGAKRARPLAGKQPDAAGSGMDQHAMM